MTYDGTLRSPQNAAYTECLTDPSFRRRGPCLPGGVRDPRLYWSVRATVAGVFTTVIRAVCEQLRSLALAGDATYLKCRQRVLEFLYERHHFVEAA